MEFKEYFSLVPVLSNSLVSSTLTKIRKALWTALQKVCNLIVDYSFNFVYSNTLGSLSEWMLKIDVYQILDTFSSMGNFVCGLLGFMDTDPEDDYISIKIKKV